MQVTMTVNGTEVTRDVEPRLLLVHFLRETLGLTGTHWGCDTSNCGVCVVLVDGEPVKSCTQLAAMAAGHEVRTVEGLADGGDAGPGAAGLHGGARPPVRLLHPRDDAHRPRAARPRSRPGRGRDPGGHLRPDLPVHRLRHDRPLHPLGRRAPGRRRRRPPRRRCRHDRRRGPSGPRVQPRRRRGGPADRLRPHAAQGGPALRPREGQLPRRHRAAGDAARRDPALARWRTPAWCRSTPPRRWPTRRCARSSPARTSRGSTSPGRPPCRPTPWPCSPRTRCGSRARRSPSSSPRTGTPPATRSS